MNENQMAATSGAAPDGERGAAGDARRLASEARGDASAVARDVKREAMGAVEHRRDEAARSLSSVAGALRDASQNLEQESAGLSRLTGTAADRLEDASRYLREREMGQMVRDAETLARRHPELVLGGAFVAGVALARFLKSGRDDDDVTFSVAGGPGGADLGDSMGGPDGTEGSFTGAQASPYTPVGGGAGEPGAYPAAGLPLDSARLATETMPFRGPHEGGGR